MNVTAFFGLVAVVVATSTAVIASPVTAALYARDRESGNVSTSSGVAYQTEHLMRTCCLARTGMSEDRRFVSGLTLTDRPRLAALRCREVRATSADNCAMDLLLVTTMLALLYLLRPESYIEQDPLDHNMCKLSTWRLGLTA